MGELREGETVTSVRGVITGVNIRDRGRFRGRESVSLTVRCGSGDEDFEEYSFEMPRRLAGDVRCGQRVAVQVVVTASEEPRVGFGG